MRPTISALRSWDIEGFHDAARNVEQAASSINAIVDSVRSLVPDTAWTGAGKDGAVDRSEVEVDAALEVRDAFTDASVELFNSYDSLYWAKEFVLQTVTDAESASLTVLDSGEVRPGANGDPSVASYHADRIKGALDDLDTTDTTARDRLRSVTELVLSLTQSAVHPQIALPGGGPLVSPDQIATLEWSGF